MIILLMYVGAIAGVELIATNEKLLEDPETEDIVKANFNGILVTMLTLVQFTTGDITPVYFPLIIRDPWLIPYFLSCYLFITLLLMNLVTAALVNESISQGAEDREIKVKRLRLQVEQYVPELDWVFGHLDADSTGDITLQELAAFNGTEQDIGHPLSDAVKEVLRPENLIDNYECFDADSSGTVNKQEFVQGCLAILVKDTPMELTQLLQLVRNSNHTLKGIQNRMDDMERHMMYQEAMS